MLMAVEGPYALMVQPDDILISPREVDEHFGTMVCFHSRYALGDSHNYMDKDDFLREMYLDTVGHDEAGLKRYEHMVNIVSSRFRHGPKTEEQAVDDAMLKVISDKYITLPLYLMDHSGLAMQTTSFNDPWDSGQVGWIYVSKEDALKEFGGEKMTGPNPDERAVDNTLLNVISKKYIMLPLYLLDHSGLAMKTTSFHDPWDCLLYTSPSPRDTR